MKECRTATTLIISSMVVYIIRTVIIVMITVHCRRLELHASLRNGFGTASSTVFADSI
jgi:hypothetical protein